MKAYRPRIKKQRINNTDAYLYFCVGLGHEGIGRTPKDAFEDWEGRMDLDYFNSAEIFWWVNKSCMKIYKAWRKLI